jgi:hypothetical protein
LLVGSEHLLLLLGKESEAAATAVDTVLMRGHENTSAALGMRALTAKTSDLLTIDTVVLEDSEGNLLLLVGNALGLGEGLLLLLLGTTEQSSGQAQSGILEDGSVSQRASRENLAGKAEGLFLNGDGFALSNESLDRLDGGLGVDRESEGTLKGLDEDLHCKGLNNLYESMHGSIIIT